MHKTTGNLAIAEPPVRPVTPVHRDRPADREPAHPADLAMLRERVRRLRMPRGECMPTLAR
jgi:hypothetical protein